MFKRHNIVTSAVGEIKSVDFFIENFPIDLKVTFFPNGYLKERLKTNLGKDELPWLKAKAKSFGIKVDSQTAEEQQIYTLSEKLSSLGHEDVIDELKEIKAKIVESAQNNPTNLIKWLYENQGEMRFGAENRLFLVLVDLEDMNASWKLKRAIDLIEPLVNDYLDNFSPDDLKDIEFTFKGNNYRTLADVIFVIKR